MRPETYDWLTEEKYVKVEPSPPYTRALNGSGERSGGVIKTKARLMRISSRLPQDLAPEIIRAAVYSHNRMLRYNYDWESPYERFHQFIADRDGKSPVSSKPQLAHLQVYGCKAYSLTTGYMKHENRLQIFNPRACIGYLVGYDSTNVYRVWNLVLNKIGKARDVTFNEDETFDDVDVNEEEVTRSRPEARDLPSTVVNELINIGNIPTQDKALGRMPNRGFGRVITTHGPQEVDKEEATSHWRGYPTPPPIPPAALLVASIQRPIDEVPMLIKKYESFVPWKATFIAGSRYKPIGTFESKTLERERISRNQSVNKIQDKKEECDRSKLQKLIQQEQLHKIHRRDLPDPPKWHRDLETHLLGEQFAQAKRAHLQSYIPMNSWTTVDQSIAKGSQILDYKHGYLVKCKARLVVRGDQKR
ncbi:hypothetical protein TSTA_121520 [Talaromyces stipitatus ATCC 10500]|uniref:Retroviral polymerase SH3-like domain-containing protein n=1 Tax=Talaromyces stipitatus (strain ATCC 10500 / CBS 375.48 / QM 6759 / NRRL 1006) TaxID=441959 RepID=B8MA80_TALSN|nr:uncharacterized protein TSTA_121520 [Talaromyces stipitatus ATCC 10500]EED18409.1 hypothetical protein TSTA_121520 [Talaromyces stipitatus ATCC 10500]